jgi:hypothetical protein
MPWYKAEFVAVAYFFIPSETGDESLVSDEVNSSSITSIMSDESRSIAIRRSHGSSASFILLFQADFQLFRVTLGIRDIEEMELLVNKLDPRCSPNVRVLFQNDQLIAVSTDEELYELNSILTEHVDH